MRMAFQSFSASGSSGSSPAPVRRAETWPAVSLSRSKRSAISDAAPASWSRYAGSATRMPCTSGCNSSSAWYIAWVASTASASSSSVARRHASARSGRASSMASAAAVSSAASQIAASSTAWRITWRSSSGEPAASITTQPSSSPWGTAQMKSSPRRRSLAGTTPRGVTPKRASTWAAAASIAIGSMPRA